MSCEGDLFLFFQTWAAWALASGVTFIIARWYFNGGQFREKVRADGKVAIVTGANTGLCKEAARQLAKRGAKVYLLCRSKERTEAAIKGLVVDGCPADKLVFLRLDLADLASVRACAQEFLSQEPQLDILINNAALAQPEFALTKDGHEKESGDGRIVHVSAKVHSVWERTVDGLKLDLDHLDDKRTFNSLIWSYMRTKLAQALNARELTKRLPAKGITSVTVNSCHPGVIETELTRNIPWWLASIFFVFRPLMLITTKTLENGVQTALFLALSEKLKGASGGHYSDCAIVSIVQREEDEQLAKDLYELSTKQLGL